MDDRAAKDPHVWGASPSNNISYNLCQESDSRKGLAVTDNRQSEQTTDEKCENGHDGRQAVELRYACPDYLGPWPVARGENAQNYESLLSSVAAYYKPSDPIEWMHVRDIADCEWQKQRMRRTVTSCIDLASIGAIERVLKSRRDHMALSARSNAEGYSKGSSLDRSTVLNLLEADGLTEEIFTFTAVCMQAAEIERIDRSAMGHQACRDEAIRNLERRRANKAPTVHKSSAEEAEFRVIEHKSEDQKGPA